MRSIWKGHIRFSLVTIAVRVYNALESSEHIRFNQIHKECHGPVGYRKYCKKCEATLEGQDIQKGYQYEPDRYVIIEEDDFQKVKLKSTRIIEIEAFVGVDEVPPALFEQPYFAGPEGQVASKSYSLLVNALKESRRVGVGKVILRDREDVVLIAPEENGLLFYRLRYPAELRQINQVPELDDIPETSKQELALAHSLIETMTRPLAELELKDRYQTALKEMIDARIAGQEIIIMEEVEEEPVDILTALKASIERARSETRGMVTATGKKTEPKASATGKSKSGKETKSAARKSTRKAKAG